MSEHLPNSNPWADKLKDMSLPGEDNAWQSMSLLLDEQLPVKKKDNRRWVLLILLLLLLIGVCNCPSGYRKGKLKGTGGTAVDTDSLSYSLVGDTNEDAVAVRRRDRSDSLPVLAKSSNPATADSAVSPDASSTTTIRNDRDEKPTDERSAKAGAGSKTKQKDTEPVTSEDLLYSGSGEAVIVARKKKNNGSSKARTQKPAANQPVVESNFSQRDLVDSSNAILTAMRKLKMSQDDSVVMTKATIDSTGFRKADSSLIEKDTIAKTVTTIKDSLAADSAKKNLPKKIDSTKQSGWAFAAGFNQFFAIGGQNASGLNGDGVSGNWKDYLPVAQVRYYFNRKLYLQIEAQLNAPQYTKPLAIEKSKTDSFGAPHFERTITLEKLFYLNMPLSVHYSPAKNFFIGTGIQFSHLSNGVAKFDQLYYFGGIPDSSTISVKTSSLKNDTAYQLLAANEWRFLLDANYRWKNFTVGARYNQSFSPFVNVQLSTGEFIKARNSSLQLYLRYTFWRSRNLKKQKIF